MKGPKTTNNYGVVHKVNNSPYKHLRKKLKHDAVIKAARNAERNVVLRSLANRRQEAYEWLQTEITRFVAGQLPEVKCPVCQKQVFLCKTPLQAIAWSDTPHPPWVSHQCAVDIRYPSGKLTEIELANEKALKNSYLALRKAMIAKGDL